MMSGADVGRALNLSPSMVIASSECATLKQKGSQVWCKRMLEEGAAAVIGPVDEPYVQAFPVPEVFFGLRWKDP